MIENQQLRTAERLNVPNKFISWMEDTFGEDIDKIDLHEYDLTLSIDENKTIFKDKFNMPMSLNDMNGTIEGLKEQEQIRQNSSIKAKLTLISFLNLLLWEL